MNLLKFMFGDYFKPKYVKKESEVLKVELKTKLPEFKFKKIGEDNDDRS